VEERPKRLGGLPYKLASSGVCGGGAASCLTPCRLLPVLVTEGIILLSFIVFALYTFITLLKLKQFDE
jgi:hypothetical protein